MAKNNLSAILGNMGVQGADRIRGGAATLNFQAAQVGVDPSYEQKADEIGNVSNTLQTLGNTFGNWMQKKEVTGKKTGEDRANYLMQHFTPDQLQKARADGVLQFQDDPYAMKALNMKVGQTISMDVDNDIAQRIDKGEFNDRKSLEEARAKAFNEQAKKLAESYGVDFQNNDVQSGLNSQVTERNITLYGKHDSWLDQSLKNKAQLQHKTENASLYSDQSFLQRPDAVDAVFGNLNNQKRLGGWDDTTYQSNVKSDIADIAARPGGAAWLANAEGKSVKLADGSTINAKAMFSQDQWDGLKLKAASAAFDQDAALKEKFNLSLSTIQHNPNIDEAEAQLAALKEDYNSRVPGKASTPERDQIIALEQNLIAQRAAQNEQLKKQLVKKNQDTNKMKVFDAQFNKRLSGKFVPTDYSNMPSNENTGDFTKADAVNYANYKLAQIDQMGLTQDQKDDLKLKYLRADADKGPFREIMGTMVSDAQKEWSGAVMNGKMPEQTPAMDKLRQIRQKDPVLFAQVYPEQADFFNTIDTMDQLGVDHQVIIDADRQAQNQTKEMRFEADKNWADLKNDSKAPELARIPTTLDGAARKIYDATLNRTGNNDMAKQQVSRFLQENTVTFTGEDVEGSTIGVVPRNLLTVTSDPASYKQGQVILEHAMKGIAEANPWVTNKNLDVSAQGNNIYITDTTGQIRVRYDKDTLSRVYAEEQTRQASKVEAEALKKATERAPIAAVNKAKQQAEARRRAKAKTIPTSIYGGQGETGKKLSQEFEDFGTLLKGKKPKS